MFFPLLKNILFMDEAIVKHRFKLLWFIVWHSISLGKQTN